MSAITTAILLAAGAGTRLRAVSASKPLTPVAGKPLLDRAVEGLACAGVTRVIVVTGYQAKMVETHIAARDWPARVETARTADWRLPNGVSALAAAALVKAEPALLAMCDHLVDSALYARVAAAGAGRGLRLGIDRRLGHEWVDPEDVTCLATRAGRITMIGKMLEPHDAYDTGVFAVGAPFFEALGHLEQPSITDAVRFLIERDAAGTVDCSDLDWIDVDDAKALGHAESWLARAGR